MLPGARAELGKSTAAIETVGAQIVVHANTRNVRELRKLISKNLQKRGVSAEVVEQTLQKIPEATPRDQQSALNLPTSWGRGFLARDREECVQSIRARRPRYIS